MCPEAVSHVLFLSKSLVQLQRSVDQPLLFTEEQSTMLSYCQNSLGIKIALPAVNILPAL